ncbi:DsbC family protein [Pseudohongiella nitratireducens]|uniref:DsbC family protein n=1 Tax=Pseudohongiella nitratireducens TaxID=1768907 RepID=UPI0030ED41D7|tara:strand:- start:4359 stop:5168 length:810 start_codon:yes stop_codon:yes gene_type:complete
MNKHYLPGRILAALVLSLSVFAVSVSVTSSAQAQQSSNNPELTEITENLRMTLNASLGAASQGQLQVVQISSTPMADLFEVVISSGEVLFADKSGTYLIAGEMFMTRPDGLVNLTAETRKTQVAQMLQNVPEEEMIIFPADDPKAEITVFTDVDCTYCRRLHGEIEQINDYGITVRYMAYPRGGQASPALAKMISVWCAGDAQGRAEALTDAKHGETLPQWQCENPVMSHYNLGNRIGVTGTPAIVMSDGTLMPGYAPADTLRERVLGE